VGFITRIEISEIRTELIQSSELKLRCRCKYNVKMGAKKRDVRVWNALKWVKLKLWADPNIRMYVLAL
jgi:hypothetical protein